MENLDYMEAVKQLADRAGMALPEDGYDDTLAKKRTAVLAANRAAAKFFTLSSLPTEADMPSTISLTAG